MTGNRIFWRQEACFTEMPSVVEVKNNVQSQRTVYKEQTRIPHEWLNTYMPDYEIQYEQFLVYFISTLFCGAVYDGKLCKGADGGCQCTFLIHELSAGTVAEE